VVVDVVACSPSGENPGRGVSALITGQIPVG
jgi:hypothetical protein